MAVVARSEISAGAASASAPVAAPVAASGRIAALDGLRGVAAAVVVVFHWLCLFHWELTPVFAEAPPRIVDTPLAILWNGPFAVSVFFVLSGFVMAAAAERRRERLVANVVTRYLRLALPVTVSVLLAWALLSLMPEAVARMQAASAEPSPWLHYTYSDSIPGVHLALADGLVANFLRGTSWFNNVLWTMQIELVGSVLLFVLYWLAEGRLRLWLLAATGLVVVVLFRDAYLAFVTGAALFEAARRGLLDRVPLWVGALALGTGLLLGAPSEGAHARLGLPEALPEALWLGNAGGLVPVLAATLLLLAVLTLRPLGVLLSMRGPQWLGRISFGLYLVHVPPLYTLVATAHLAGAMPPVLLAGVYFAGVLVAAHLFTLAVDEPSLRGLQRLRPRLSRLDPFAARRLAARAGDVR